MNISHYTIHISPSLYYTTMVQFSNERPVRPSWRFSCAGYRSIHRRIPKAAIHQAVRRLTDKSRGIGRYDNRIALKFGKHLGTVAAEMPVKFQNDWKSMSPYLMASETSRDLVVRPPSSWWIEAWRCDLFHNNNKNGPIFTARCLFVF